MNINNIWSYIVQGILIVSFAVGSYFFWTFALSKIHITRNSRVSRLLESLKQKEDRVSFFELLAQDSNMPMKMRVYYERARLAGWPHDFTYNIYVLVRWLLAIIFGVFSLISQVKSLDQLMQLNYSSVIFLLLIIIVFGTIGFWILTIALMGQANSKKTLYLLEIAKLSQRLALCVNEKSDVRDTLLLASRPLKLLKPHIQEMAAGWGKNQRLAIQRFKDSVGISEVYPLVNALIAISEIETAEIVTVLKQETENIDATLESDVNRKIENAPVLISFLIMIPFAINVILFLFPWVSTVKNQILTNYTSP